MENSMQFLELDESYLPQMAELYRTAFGQEPWNDDWSDSRQLTAYIRELSCSPFSLCFGLLQDDRLMALSIGMLRHWWEGTNYNIDEFCIAPDLQRQGLGSQFLQMIEAEVRRRGAAGIFLQTDSDKPSYRFYQKNGFQELTSHVSFFKKLEP